MKKSYRNISRSSLVTLAVAALFCLEASAATAVAVVNSLSGRAFYTVDGSTKSLHVGDQVPAFSEVYTEVGAQLSMSDYYDHKYHLAGSGHVQFLSKSVQLKDGYLWVQSYQDNQTFSVQTANSVSTFKRGEAIVSFDGASGKSQLLVKKGQWQYANSFSQEFSQTIVEGQFSFITIEETEGFPRAGTPIGYKSFNKVVALFKNIDQSAPAGMQVERNIASVQDEFSTPSAAPVVDMNPAPTAVAPKVDTKMDQELLKLYAPKLVTEKPKKKKWAPSYVKPSNVEIRIFGASQKPKVKKTMSAKATAPKQRAPASVVAPKVAAPALKNDPFESQLMKEYKNQMRHSSETNKLINELKSFDQDYVEGY